MKATELRIGNYYATDGGLDLPQNTSIVESNVFMNWEVNGCWAKPIPLTEEWLVKFGFENNSMNLDEEGFLHLDISFIGGVNVYINDMEYSHINHVHQLQNLYFALTGEEIKCS